LKGDKMSEARISYINKIRAGTEQQNYDNICEHCENDLQCGGIKISFECFRDCLVVCSECMKVGKINHKRRKTD
jgi:hypothetical protein